MANFFEQFVSPAPDPNAQQASAPNWFEQFTAPSAPEPSVAADVAKSAAIGPVKGTIGLAGMPGDLGNLLSRGVEKLVDFVSPNLPPDRRKMLIDHFNDRLGTYSFVSPDMPTSADVRGGVEQVTGPLYEPRTEPGRVAQTAGEFLPSAMMGPGGVARRVVGGAIIPGTASELAGHAVEGTGAEAPVRLATALLTGSINAATVRPATAIAAIKQNLPAGVTAQMVEQANALIQDGAARGVSLTWPEALSHVAGRPILTNAQRIAESAPQSRDTMEAFMGQRPGQMQQAVGQELSNIAPPSRAPSAIGPAVADAATSTINDVRAAINKATRPMYDAAGQTLVPPTVHAAMIADPLFESALKTVRSDPAWRSVLGAQSDRSISVYDAVKQELQQRAQNAAMPTNPNASQMTAATAGTRAGEVRAAAIEADKAATQGPSSYEAALETQARLRDKYLNPLMSGPLGRLADAPDTKRAINALFPANPLGGSADEISTAVSAVAKRNPMAARQLVRAHLEMELNNAFEAAGRGQEAAQFAGATFAKNVAGSPVAPGARAENLQAAIEALPGGRGLWPGVQRMLEVAQATGARQPKGSLTSFNTRELERMSTGNTAANVAKHMASPGTWWDLAEHAIGRWQLGRNLNQMADIITDPKSAVLFRTLSKMPPQSARAQAIVARLVAQSAAAADQQ